MGVNGIDDYWTQQVGAPAQQPFVNLSFEAFADITPLDHQFGVDSPKTVPDPLFAIMFGAAESQATSTDDRPLHTYALLDAAKVPALPELLANSGLEHRCLFKGDAFDALKDSAPWLVRLEKGNTFTRNLFTRSDAPWHLWDDEAGLYLRSHATIVQVWKHLRKFTRVQDEAGKWFYFRFWETDCLIEYMRFAQASGKSDLRPLFGTEQNKPSLPLVQTYISVGRDKTKLCTLTNLSGSSAQTHTKVDMSVLRFLALRSHAYRFVDSFFEKSDDRISADHLRQAKEMATHIAQKYHGYGFKSRYHLGSFIYWALELNADFGSRTHAIQDQVHRKDADPNERFVLIAREMKNTFGPKIRNYHGHGT